MPLTVRKHGENVVITIATSIFFRSTSILQVTSRGKKSRSSSIISKIDSFRLELSVLKCFLSIGKCCHHRSGFSFYQINFILADNEDRHKISVKFDFGLNWIIHPGLTCP